VAGGGGLGGGDVEGHGGDAGKHGHGDGGAGAHGLGGAAVEERTGAREVKLVPTPPVVACQPATSATRWVLPELLKMLTRPPLPTLTTTALATVWPAAKFTLEATGRASPVGNTVRWPGALARSRSR
jgi:hypothetical protein